MINTDSMKDTPTQEGSKDEEIPTQHNKHQHKWKNSHKNIHLMFNQNKQQIFD
uniref:Uncharacterized protein n=1 Tax=Arion vulgaris TaxID=1028688 RepID=A0A0B6ZTQ2_9EUPU